MENQKSTKITIGFLALMMMLGMASFSLQVVAGGYQQDSGHSADVYDNYAKAADNNGSGAPDAPIAPDASHSMDSSPETGGFLAVPWIPVSFIRQTIFKDTLLMQTGKFTRSYTIKPYNSDKRNITARTIYDRSNTSYLTQALTLHISKLSAG